MHKLNPIKGLSVLIALLLFSCSSPETTYNDLTVDQVLLPVVVVKDTTKVALSSLSVEQPLYIDSVQCEAYSIDFLDDTLVILGSDPSGLTVLHLYDRDIRYSTVIQDLRSSQNPMSNQIICTDASRTEINFELPNAEQTYVFWNNLMLATKGTNGHYSAPIPPFAKYKAFAHVLIYGIDTAGMVYSRVLPLLKGKMVTTYDKMRQPMVKDALALSHLHLSLGLEALDRMRYQVVLDKLRKELIEDPKHIAAVYGRFELKAHSKTHRVYLASYMGEHCWVILNVSEDSLNFKSDTKKYKTMEREYDIKPLSAKVIPIL